MNLRHLAGHAVDLIAWVNGWLTGDLHNYDKFVFGDERSWMELGIPVEWGGDWKDLRMVRIFNPFEGVS